MPSPSPWAVLTIPKEATTSSSQRSAWCLEVKSWVSKEHAVGNCGPENCLLTSHRSCYRAPGALFAQVSLLHITNQQAVQGLTVTSFLLFSAQGT